MTTIRKMMDRGIAAALLLTGLTTGAQALGAGGGGPPSLGGELRGMTQITGSVLCVGCSLNEVRAAQPELHRLYQLTIGGALGAAGGGLTGDQLQRQETAQYEQQRQIAEQEREIARQRQELERLRQQQED